MDKSLPPEAIMLPHSNTAIQSNGETFYFGHWNSAVNSKQSGATKYIRIDTASNVDRMVYEALKSTRDFISKGAEHGFSDTEWLNELYFSQQFRTTAIKAYEALYNTRKETK